MSFPLHTVNIVGAGNVATHLAKALHESGFVVQQIYSRDLAVAEKLAHRFSAEAINEFQNIKPADIAIIAIPDDAVQEVARQLPKSQSLVVHTSGTLDLSVFGDRERVGIFYPLQTFSAEVPLVFENIPILVDGKSPMEVEEITQLAKLLGNKTYRLDPEQKKWLHLNAVVVNNFTNHLFALAKESSEAHGVPFELYSALMKETVEKALRTSPEEAQTGPAKRGDQNVIEEHQKLLESEDPNSDLAKLYPEISKSIQKKHTSQNSNSDEEKL
ncbi:MAG: DUF2520 domain-containing protein [Schleiferiaceae bacterium]